MQHLIVGGIIVTQGVGGVNVPLSQTLKLGAGLSLTDGILSSTAVGGGGTSLPPDASGVLQNNGSGGLSWTPLPVVNNATLTVNQNGVSAGTFAANASANATINITAANWDAASGTAGYIANKPAIPNTANLVTTDTAQTISGVKTFSGSNPLVAAKSTNPAMSSTTAVATEAQVANRIIYCTTATAAATAAKAISLAGYAEQLGQIIGLKF